MAIPFIPIQAWILIKIASLNLQGKRLDLLSFEMTLALLASYIMYINAYCTSQIKVLYRGTLRP